MYNLMLSIGGFIKLLHDISLICFVIFFRIKTYNESTMAIIEHYRNLNLVSEIKAEHGPETVSIKLIAMILIENIVLYLLIYAV